MNRTVRKVLISTLLVLLIIGLFPITAFAAPASDIVIGNSYTLADGQTLDDDLFIIGGSVELQNGSTVNGNVLLIGGSLQAGGKINGDVTVLGGTAILDSTLILNGNLSTTGTSVSQHPGAQINGQIRTGEITPNIILPGGMRIPDWSSAPNIFLRGVGFFLRLFLWALVAMVLAMFIPSYLSRTSQAELTQPLISGGLGILTVIIVPIVIVLLAITICLIPVAIIAAIILVCAWAFGMIALGLEVGKRIGLMFRQEWHPAIAAGVGTLALMTVLNGLEAIVPCVGWIPKVLAGCVGLGAVLLTQFGINAYTLTPSLSRENPAA